MKNRFKKTVEMEKMHYLGGEDIDDDAKKEKNRCDEIEN